MNILKTQNFKLDDIIFENRNKDYGAYQLRRTATLREFKALLAGLLLYFLIFYPLYLRNLESVRLYELNKKTFSCCCIYTLEPTIHKQIHFSNIRNKEYLNQVAFPPPNIVPDEIIVERPFILNPFNVNDLPKKYSIFKDKDRIENYLIIYSELKIPTKFRAFSPDKNDYDDYPAYFKSERAPEIKNEMKGLRIFMKKNLKYPVKAKKNKIEGVIFVQFVIEKDGSMTDIHVLNKLGFGTEKEALRLVYNLPKWKPAMKRWKIIKSRVTLPIIFKLK